jgi:diguanylate cyclase (GGDEF)-like protein
MTMPGDTYLKHLTTVMPIRAMVRHDFQFMKNSRTHIAIKCDSAFIEGKDDLTYLAETDSKDWRLLDDNDPMVQTVKNRVRDRYQGEYIHNVKNLKSIGEERRYERFVIGHTIYSFAFYEDRLSLESRPAYMDLIQQGVITYVSREMTHLQSSSYKVIKDELQAGLQSFEVCLSMILENSAKMLYDHFGFVTVKYQFPAEVRNLFGEDISAQASFSFIEPAPEGCIEANKETGECDETAEPETYNHDWHGTDNSLGYTLYLTPSIYRDLDMEKALFLKNFLETLSHTLHDLFDHRLGMLRSEQDKAHMLRCQTARHALGLKELIDEVKRNVTAYFDEVSLDNVFVEITAGNNIINAFSEKVTAAYNKRSKMIPVLHDGNYDVHILVPQKATISLKRVQEYFDEYVEAVKDGFMSLLNNYDLLTGLWNQSKLLAALEKDISLIKSNQHVHLTVVWADIYKFKIINELFGHWFADEWLKYNAVQMLKYCHFVSRLHGDEHVLVFKYYDEEQIASPTEKEYLQAQGVMAQGAFQAIMDELVIFSNNETIPVYLKVGDASPAGDSPVANVELEQLIQNFFAINELGQINLKAYSRDGANDYKKLIMDPQGRVSELVRETFRFIRKNNIELDSVQFKEYVLNNNRLGSQITVMPQLSLGRVDYDHATIPSYPSDILIAAEAEWAKHKKQ